MESLLQNHFSKVYFYISYPEQQNLLFIIDRFYFILGIIIFQFAHEAGTQCCYKSKWDPLSGISLAIWRGESINETIGLFLLFLQKYGAWVSV